MANSEVTIPEKTLEHWVSQYVNYRYKTWASLWWPALGEDVSIGSIPARPGKAVRLEIKTATNHGRDGEHHDVNIDVRQLWRYLQRPLGEQPFYVYPAPRWRGLLVANAASRGADVAEIAFQRGRKRHSWFADWMFVLTAADVGVALAVNPTGPEPAKHTRRLVRCTCGNAARRSIKVGPLVSFSATSGTVPTRLVDFFDELDRCGRAGWPQLLRLSAAARGVQLTRDRALDSLIDQAPKGGDTRYGPRDLDADLVSFTPRLLGDNEINGTWVYGSTDSEVLYPGDGDTEEPTSGAGVMFIDSRAVRR